MNTEINILADGFHRSFLFLFFSAINIFVIRNNLALIFIVYSED